MKKRDTPQQPHKMYDGESKGVYAVNEQGEYELTRTTGWEPETIVLNQALAEIDRLTSQTLEKVRQGQSSPLEYHMYAQRMDLPMLAKAVGKFQWQVKRHFKPHLFAKLPAQQLELYAIVLGLDVDSLKVVPNG